MTLSEIREYVRKEQESWPTHNKTRFTFRGKTCNPFPLRKEILESLRK